MVQVYISIDHIGLSFVINLYNLLLPLSCFCSSSPIWVSQPLSKGQAECCCGAALKIEVAEMQMRHRQSVGIALTKSYRYSGVPSTQHEVITSSFKSHMTNDSEQLT
jgi:hypothetical protein